jgi:hypothetical protein
VWDGERISQVYALRVMDQVPRATDQS